MTIELYANEDAITHLSIAATNTDQTLSVTTSANFPAVDGTTQFHARIRKPIEDGTHEYIVVTNIVGNTWHVGRGVESTIPIGWDPGSVIEPVVTADVMRIFARADLANLDVDALAAFLSLGTAAKQDVQDFDAVGAAADAQNTAITTSETYTDVAVNAEALARANAIASAVSGAVSGLNLGTAAHVSTGTFDSAGAAASAQTVAIATSKSYVDGLIATEAASRATGDSNAVSTAHSYTDSQVSAEASARATAITSAIAALSLGSASRSSTAAFDAAGAATAATATAHAYTDTVAGTKADLVSGKIPTSQLPSIAIGDAVTVASQAAMLALTSVQVQPGDVAIRSDGAGTFMLTNADPSLLSHWVLLSSPGGSGITSVNGYTTPSVTLGPADVGAVAPTRIVAAGTGLTGGGDLSANRTISANVGTTTGTLAAGDDSRITGAAQKASNLSDLSSASTARSNLGLGDAAVKNTGSSTGTLAAGDDSRITGAAQKATNLGDLANATTARTNLGLGDAAVKNTGTATGSLAAGDDSRIVGAAQKANNLSDLPNAATARTNLGLAGAAVLAVGTGAGTVAAGDDSRITGAAAKANNLSDLPNAGTARTNLGLGNSATRAVGTTSGTVAAGDDGRITGAAKMTVYNDTSGVWPGAPTGGGLFSGGVGTAPPTALAIGDLWVYAP